MSHRLAALTLLMTLASSIAWGHPGHSVETSDTTSLHHYATHPDHLPTYLVALFAIGGAILIIRRVLTRKPAPAYAKARRQHRNDK